MQFTDSHIHLQDYNANNAQQIINDLRFSGFIKVVCMSSNPQDWDKVADLALTYPEMVTPAFGLHPWYVTDAPSNWQQSLKKYLLRFPTAWLGECGLDRLKAPTEAGQEEVFLSQVSLAKELNRPLSIHMLKAEDWLSRFFKQMPDKFMLHSFGSSLEFMLKALANGAYISLSATILKRKNVGDIILNIPLSRLLLESDAPYLSSSGDIALLAKEIARMREIEENTLLEQVYTNFKEFSRGK